MYDLTIAIINKCFEFQSDWLKIIHIVLPHCVKEIKNFEQYKNFLSDMHQNLISFKLYQGATEYKVSSISGHYFLRYIRPTDRHFLKKVRLCSGHLKTWKSIENRMSKIFANPVLFSYAYQESKMNMNCLSTIND